MQSVIQSFSQSILQGFTHSVMQSVNFNHLTVVCESKHTDRRAASADDMDPTCLGRSMLST